MKAMYSLLGSLLVATAIAERPGTQEQGGGVSWYGDLAEATRAAEDSGRAMLVVFR